jgi:hypothetical protein
VPGSCAKCHTPGGCPCIWMRVSTFRSRCPMASNAAPATTIWLSSPRYEVEEVEFPSGMVVSLKMPNDNLCMNCHQGRQSTVSVNAHIGDAADDEVSDAV